MLHPKHLPVAMWSVFCIFCLLIGWCVGPGPRNCGDGAACKAVCKGGIGGLDAFDGSISSIRFTLTQKKRNKPVTALALVGLPPQSLALGHMPLPGIFHQNRSVVPTWLIPICPRKIFISSRLIGNWTSNWPSGMMSCKPHPTNDRFVLNICVAWYFDHINNVEENNCQ
jgi:hypothetical protein